MKKIKILLFVIIAFLLTYILSWAKAGKREIIIQEYNFLKSHKYFYPDSTQFIIDTDNNTSLDRIIFSDALKKPLYIIEDLSTDLRGPNEGKSIINIDLRFYSPFIAKVESGHWIYGTDGVFQFESYYTWGFKKWLLLNRTILR